MPKKICSKYMSGKNPIKPLRVWPGMRVANLVDDVFAKSSYQARNLAKAAKLLYEAKKNNRYIWTSISGAATPTGLGGIVSQLIETGFIDGIVSTGANVYHDLHFVFGLPVEQGSPQVDDDELFKDGTTRIYDTFIRNSETLKVQDMLNRKFAKKVIKKGKLEGKFSTATLLHELGKEMLEDKSGLVRNKNGSMVLSAAKYNVPIYLDSGANHSLGMDLASLMAEGLKVDTSPSLDVLEMAALSWKFQPQFNFCIGEGGPRNFLQTTGPTASEIFYLPFEGSEGCVILSVADERAGALSGSTPSEAKSWGKYLNADMKNKIVVWGEYTITLPIIAAYLSVKLENYGCEPRRLMLQMDETRKEFSREIKKHRSARDKDYTRLTKELQKRRQNAPYS